MYTCLINPNSHDKSRYLSDKATGTVKETRVRLLAGTRTSFFTINSTSVLRLRWPLFDTKYGITRVVRLPEPEAHHAVPSAVDVNTLWKLSFPPAAFIPCRFSQKLFYHQRLDFATTFNNINFL
jgi:hypothetical protein